MELISIQELKGKRFSGDPRTRTSTGGLTYIFSDTPEYVSSKSVEMTYDGPALKPRNRQENWHWYNWKWSQTNPPVHQSCCYSGLADVDGNCDDVYFLVEEIFNT